MEAAGPAGPLTGITVLDLCSYLAGPYGCTLLADLGANVVKIEAPQAATSCASSRRRLPGDSRFFVGANRGKRALALDLKQPEGLAVLHRMVESADVLVENFRPAVPARLGIDYPRLKKINPRLVYCGVTGYGDEGPLREKGGFDQVLQCLTGMAVFQGARPGTAAAGAGVGARLFHLGAGRLWGGCGAISPRAHPGRHGQYLSLSLLRSALTIQAGRFVWAEGEGRDVAREFRGRRAHRHPPDKKRRALYFRPFKSFLCGFVRVDRPAGAGARPALRHDAQPRCACL